MICPHCQYNDDIMMNGKDIYDFTYPPHGRHYELELKLVREYMATGHGDYGNPQRTNLYGCPNCKKTFID